MQAKDGKIKEIWGRKFRIIKNGLDERDVFSEYQDGNKGRGRPES
jgi:hypothetical protein